MKYENEKKWTERGASLAPDPLDPPMVYDNFDDCIFFLKDSIKTCLFFDEVFNDFVDLFFPEGGCNDYFLKQSMMTLMAPPAPVRAVSKALIASSSGKWCVTRGLAFTLPDAIIANAVGYLQT